MSSESHSSDPPARSPVLRELTGLDAEQQAERLAYFDLGPADRQALRDLAPLARRTVDGLVAEFYEHLLRFPELAALLRADPERLERLKEKQRAYFLELTEGRLDEDYFESRLRVGDAHQRVGLRPAWYLGAFALYLRLALRALLAETGEGQRALPAFEALIKIVFLDMSLAMNTYIYGGFVQREIATELERAAQVAEEALRAHAEVERLKDDLNRMVVHDLKNPVSGIAMLAQLALRKGTDLPEAHRGYLVQIDRTCREMMRLIQNLLEISKIEEGKMPVVREPVSLAELADEVVEEYAAVAEQGQRAVRTDVRRDLPQAVADRWLLRRVLTNLVVNAIRHSGSRDVQVDAATGPEPGEVTLRVTDFGHGIAPEDQALIFEKFRSSRRLAIEEPADDTGLGLPFCKLAVERMGGRTRAHQPAGRDRVRGDAAGPGPRGVLNAAARRPSAERYGAATIQERQRRVVPDRGKPALAVAVTVGIRLVRALSPGWQGICREIDMTTRVRSWMKHPVVGVKPRDSAAHARALMEQHRVNQLPVLQGPRLVGIVTDRDLRDAFPSLAETTAPSRRRPPKGAEPSAIPVEDVMTHDVLTVEPDTPLDDAARLLRRERIGALPVVSAGRVVGILTRSDLLEALAQLLADEAADRPRPGSTTDGPR